MSFICWGNCPSDLIDCGTFCAPKDMGSCANFLGASWQNCAVKYGSGRRLLALEDNNSSMKTTQKGQVAMSTSSAYDRRRALHNCMAVAWSAAGGRTANGSSIITSTGTALHNCISSIHFGACAGRSLIAAVVPEDSRDGAGVSMLPASWWRDTFELRAATKGADGHVNASLSDVDVDADNVFFSAMRRHAAYDCATRSASGADAVFECQCHGKMDGTTTGNPFLADPAAYVLCIGGVALEASCPPGLAYSSALHRCDAPALPPAVVGCAGKKDGFYFLDSTKPETAYMCDDGVMHFKLCGASLDHATGECLLPKPKPSPIPCETADCYCADKPDGKYADVLAGDAHRHIECLAGTGRSVACPPYTMWHEGAKTCGVVQRNSTVLAPNCKELKCFCMGRPDGMYNNPFKANTGISCDFQQSSLISCPEGKKFDRKKVPMCQAVYVGGAP